MKEYILRPDFKWNTNNGYVVLENNKGDVFFLTKLEATIVYLVSIGKTMEEAQDLLTIINKSTKNIKVSDIIERMGHFLVDKKTENAFIQIDSKKTIDIFKIKSLRFIPENERKNYPRYISWRITNQCNRDCKYCYAYERKDDKRTKTSYWEKLIYEANEAGVKGFLLTGGDPLMADHIVDIIGKILMFDMSVTLLTKNKLPESLIISDPSLLHIVFSLDTTIEEKANWITGSCDYYETITDSMKKLSEKDFPFSIQMTVIKPLLHSTFESIKELLLYHPKTIKINRFGAVGKKEIDKAFYISDAEWMDFISGLNSIELNQTKLIVSPVEHLENSCIAGTVRLSMNQNGDYIICDVLDNNMAFGNINDTKILDVWNSADYISKCYQMRGECHASDI